MFVQIYKLCITTFAFSSNLHLVDDKKSLVDKQKYDYELFKLQLGFL